MVQRVLLLSLFVIGNIFGAWSFPAAQSFQIASGGFSARPAFIPNGAPPALLTTVTLADLGYVRDETLQGISATRSYSLNWPDAWEVQPGNTFTINFSHSPSLEQYSSLAVDWNGVRLGSILMTPENATGGSLAVNIPDDQIESGYNQLRVVLYMGIQDERCEDPNNPATWATIHSSSFFDISYAEKTPEANLGLFPQPLLDNSALVENSVLFVLPDEPTAGELNALSLISAKLGQLAAWRTISMDTMTESEMAGQSEPFAGDVVYIGPAGRLGALTATEMPFVQATGSAVSFQTEAGNPIEAEAGVLWMQPSAGNPTGVDLFVTGADEAAVLTAARALASEATYPRLQGPLGVVLGVPEPDPDAETVRQTITFEELGYQDETASGTRQQRLNFIIPLPMQWQVLTEATLNLHFAHSRLLHERQSSLTVAVNNSPVGSVLLTAENADDGNASFAIPARQLIIGDNRITITTEIELIDGYEDATECDDEHITEAWVVVYSDSSFDLPGGPASRTLNLSDYPFAFIGRPDLSDLVFILPDQPGAEAVDGLARISSQMGRSAEGPTLFPHVVTASQAATASDWPYQILIGMPSENPAIVALNDDLPMPFQAGTNQPEPLPQVARLADPNGTGGYVQAVMQSDGQPRLVVTGSDQTGVSWASAALSQPELMRDLNGDLAILDSEGTVTTAHIHQPVAPVEMPAEAQAQTTPTSWLVWLAGGLFLLAIVVLLIITVSDINNRRKARKSYEPPNL